MCIVSTEGLGTSIRRGFILTLLAGVMVVASFALFEDAPQRQVQFVRFASLIPLTIGLLDVLTITTRRDTRSIPVVALAATKRSLVHSTRRARRGFGTHQTCTVEEGYILSCDTCHREELQGIHVSYQKGFRLLGYPVHGKEQHEGTYCAVCVDDPTFEIDREWGRRERVEQELQQYYRKR